jgi:8-hydroxy-5-deazaflavin:NADPH oxidoreductase
MKYGILGTGMVGQTLATKLVEMGHDLMMGSRSAGNEKALAWQKTAGSRAKVGTFRDTAKFGETLIAATEGETSLDALRSTDSKDLEGKTLIDVSNPLDFSKGMPPTLSTVNTDSLGEKIQREFPQLKVVKALNTCNCKVMVDPSRVPGEHDLFICGNDAAAKEQVRNLVREWGWKTIYDLGDITNARATEQLMPLWIRLFVQFGNADFDWRIVKK